MKPDYYLSHDTIQMFADRIPTTDEQNDVRQLAREFLLIENRLQRAIRKLARRASK